MDCATQFLFGKDVRSLSAGLPYPNQPEDLTHPANAFAHAFARAQGVLVRRSRIGRMWPLTEFWGDVSEPHMKVVNAFVEPLVSQAVEKKKLRAASGSAEKGDEDVLLYQLAETTEDRIILRDEVMNMMVAGRDTVSPVHRFCEIRSVTPCRRHPQ
jgi:hypothetical protein